MHKLLDSRQDHLCVCMGTAGVILVVIMAPFHQVIPFSTFDQPKVVGGDLIVDDDDDDDNDDGSRFRTRSQRTTRLTKEDV